MDLSPKKLFLLDGIGALLSAFLLGVVLTAFNEHVGMPQEILLLLSLIASILAAYSLCCYFFASKNWRPLLRTISIANLLYCCLTVGLVVSYFSQLTFLGLTYFVLEIVLV